MSKQLKIMEKKPVVIGGIRQNCYVLDTKPLIKGIKKNRTIPSFYALEKENLSNGYVEKIIEKDYPINADSINSQIESSDYRNDPAQAIANAPKRVNLGDITDVQNFIKENPVQATLQYADILKKVGDYMASQASQVNQGQVQEQEQVTFTSEDKK